jgi:hypothetical protein
MLKLTFRNKLTILTHLSLAATVLYVITAGSRVASADVYTEVLSPNSLTLPAGDLLHGLTPSVSGGSYGTSNFSGSGPGSILTDGVIGNVWPNVSSTNLFFVGDGGVDITINLPTPETINQINTYTDWNYNRVAQLYTILTSTDGINFTPLITVDDTYSANANVVLGQVTGFLLSGVEAIRWAFAQTQTGQGFHGVAYDELAAFGPVIATPEVTSWLLLGTLLVPIVLAKGRRKRVA